MQDPQARPGAAVPNARALVLAAVLAGLVLRLAFAFGYWIDKPLTHDEREYLELAESLATGRGFRYPAPPPDTSPEARYGRAPLYPAFLAAVRLAGGADEWLRNVRLAQCAVGALGIWCLAAVARRAGGLRGWVAGAWLAALYPPFVWMSAYVLTESVYATLAATVVLAIGPAIDGVPAPAGSRASDLRAGILAGLLAGAGVLVRPAMLFFLLLAGAWLLARRRLVLLGALAAAALLVIGPWTARNYREHGRLVLVASEGGLTFWTGNHPLSPGEGDLAANPAIKMESRRLRAAHPGLTEEQLEPIYYREAIRAIVAEPGWWVGLLGRKLFHTVVPGGPSYTLHSLRYRAASMLSYLAVLPLAIAGLVRARMYGTWPRAMVLLAASAVLVCVVFLPQERFRLSGIDPTLVVGAAAWWGLRGHGRRGPA
jgi:uncharacterized membrane protein